MTELGGTGLVADDVYLLAHSDVSGKPYVQPRALGLGLAGGLLSELVLAGAVSIRYDDITVLARRPPPDDLLVRVLRQVAAEPQAHPVGDWLAYLARTAPADVAERLAASGYLAPGKSLLPWGAAGGCPPTATAPSARCYECGRRWMPPGHWPSTTPCWPGSLTPAAWDSAWPPTSPPGPPPPAPCRGPARAQPPRPHHPNPGGGGQRPARPPPLNTPHQEHHAAQHRQQRRAAAPRIHRGAAQINMPWAAQPPNLVPLGRLRRFDQRLEVAWHAIIEHLYASGQPPTPREMMQAATRAVNHDVQGIRQFHGRNAHGRYAGTTIKGFERYWWYTASPAPGPENKVTERLALAQIWPRLHPRHQQVLAALAAHGDYGRAAATLGISRRLFTARLSDARQAFLKLWHEGESPSRVWCTGKTTAIRRRRAHRARRAAETGQPLRPTPGARPRVDLGISDADLVHRYEAGESVRQFATALGTYYSVIHNRLLAEGAQLRPPGQPALTAFGALRSNYITLPAVSR